MDNYSEPLANGHIEVLTLANPAAGDNWTTLLANNFTYEIIGIRYRLVTDANAADRINRIQIVQGSNALLDLSYPIIQIATESIDWSFFHGSTDADNTANSLGTGPLPPHFTVPGNFTIRSLLINDQVGDQFTNIDIYLRKWVTQTA